MLHVDKRDQLNMSYVMWTMGFTLVMVDHNYHRVFMNDLPLHMDSSLDMYADNSTLGASGKTIEDLEVKLNSGMAKVNKWYKDNKIAINCDTIKVMLVTTY